MSTYVDNLWITGSARRQGGRYQGPGAKLRVSGQQGLAALLRGLSRQARRPGAGRGSVPAPAGKAPEAIFREAGWLRYGVFPGKRLLLPFLGWGRGRRAAVSPLLPVCFFWGDGGLLCRPVLGQTFLPGNKKPA